ncbi:MAG: ATP-dependent metallopeptidase FtsH/Yme1/Tma family protein, partial [Candidatus Magasanikbacteria bacterium]
MKSFLKNFIVIFLVLLLVAATLGMIKSGSSSAPQVIGVGKLVEEINAGQVKKVVVKGDTLEVELKDAKAPAQQVTKET